MQADTSELVLANKASLGFQHLKESASQLHNYTNLGSELLRHTDILKGITGKPRVGSCCAKKAGCVSDRKKQSSESLLRSRSKPELPKQHEHESD